MFKCPCQVKYKEFIIIIIIIIIRLALALLMVYWVFADIGSSLYTPDVGTAQQKA